MGLCRESPKIVQIDTRYVETDAVNFREVVQRLTGKNSSTDWIGRRNNDSSCSNGGIAKPRDDAAAAKETLLPSSSSFSSMQMMMNNVSSFKDFDGFMLPPIDMTPWSYS